jgi:uracil-DNA glycosylase
LVRRLALKLIKAINHGMMLIVVKYTQDYYLRDKKTLTERVKKCREYQPKFLLLPHPSPRNNIWLKWNSWFENDILP